MINVSLMRLLFYEINKTFILRNKRANKLSSRNVTRGKDYVKKKTKKKKKKPVIWQEVYLVELSFTYIAFVVFIPICNRELATLHGSTKNLRKLSRRDAAFAGGRGKRERERGERRVCNSLSFLYLTLYDRYVRNPRDINHGSCYISRVHRYLLRLHDNLIVRRCLQSDVIFAKEGKKDNTLLHKCIVCFEAFTFDGNKNNFSRVSERGFYGH
ncbi:hypothetical protein PUN28_001663 [Cardiocondyla obscurior]|uniref:Uncharacterized protein n=1 Tax=Cardiocondyla obscurior TaxID=286306 RepID=A0AAW2GQM7_9HYME